MAGEEPLVLPVGTEVSAKYRGAFCEAKVKKIVKLVKCKVTLSEPRSQIVVSDEDVRGTLKAGAKVEVKHPESGVYVEATLNKLTDCSMYTVVFDDSDENTLRRTQLCLKGEKHFVKSETLDQLPLTHPEHFGTPVMKGYKGTKRRRTPTGAGVSDSDSESEASECSSPRKRIYTGRLRDLVGRVLCMEIDDRKKTTWVPVLTIIPSAADMELKTRDHLLVKSFKDSRIHTVARKDTKEFVRDMAIKNEDKALKPAMEKALAYYDSRDLPSNWDREELLGVDSEDEEESDTSDDVPTEEKDHFVAQLYKFMDDRDTPINKPPSIGTHDLNLYRLFMLVRNLGGYNKVTNLMKWKMVYSKMNLPSSTNAYNQIKTAYKKYLHAYEDFYRKLGSTMGNRPGRTRHSSGRSLLSFREREAGQPKSPRAEKKKEDKIEEEKEEEKTGDDKKEDDKTKVKEPEKKESEVKTKKAAEERKSAVKDEFDVDVDSPRKRRSRNTPGEKKPEEKGEEKVNKRVTREDAAKMKDETKVKEEGERSRRSTSKKVEEVEDKEDAAQKRRSVPLRKKGGKVEEKEDVKKKAQDETVSDGGPDDDSDDGEDEEEDEPPPPPLPEPKKGRSKELSLGTKLKVRYGRGRNQKIYEAKVVEAEQEGGSTHYLVHYAGWNNRYDEWVQRDRIVAVVSEGTDSDKRLLAAKKLISPKSAVIKKLKRPGGPSPTPSTSKTETKSSKPKQPTPTPTPTSGKARPTRSSGPELPTPTLPTRRSRRGSGVGDNASDLTSHVSDSESDDDESGTDDKRMDTDDTDSLKLRSDKSDTKSRSQTRTKTMKKDKDISDSESDVSEPTTAKDVKSKGKYDVKGQGQSRVKPEVKQESDEQRSEEEDGTEVDSGKKPAGKCTPTRPTKSTVKPEEAAPSPGTSGTGGAGEEAMELGGMEKKANQLMAKEEDAQSEDDILKDLKVNHHIDMGDILVYPDSDMSIAPPKPKASNNPRGKRRKSTDSLDEVSRQDSLDTVAYGYDIQDAVQNILDQLDDGDDDSDDLPFLTPNKEQKLFSVEGEKKEETKIEKVKKEKKADKEKTKEKVMDKPKAKAVKKADKAAAEDVKQESDNEKDKKPQEADKKKKAKKKKVKKKIEGEKEGDVSLQMTPEKEVKAASSMGKVEQVSTAPCTPSPRGAVSEDVISPPQLAAVTPNKDKDQLTKTDLARLELNVQPPKLQAERLDPPKPEPKAGVSQPTSTMGVVAPAVIPTLTTAITATSKPSLLTHSPPPKLHTAISQPSSSLSPSSLSTVPSLPVSSPTPTSTATTTAPVTPSPCTPPKVQPPPAVPATTSVPAPPCTSSTATTTSTAASIPTPSTTTSTSTTSSINPPPAPSTAASTAAAVIPPPTSTTTPPASPPHRLQPAATLFDNTPPETPEGSPAAAPPPTEEARSPCHPEQSAATTTAPATTALPSSSITTLTVPTPNTKTDSSTEQGATLLLPGGESPNACDTSTISNGSEGSSGNMPSSEDSTEGSSLMTLTAAAKRKMASEDAQQQPAKKRKRGSKRSSNADKGKSTPKHTMSDSDEGPEAGSTTPKGGSEPHTTSSKGTPHNLTPSKGPTHSVTPSKGTPHALTPSKGTPSKGKTPVPGPSPAAPGSSGSSPNRDEPRPPRPSKYNFNLEEGNYLEGDQRIFFIMEKLQDIRKIYMSLKAEVACIDRRRKRAKRREKEGTAMALASLANS